MQNTEFPLKKTFEQDFIQEDKTLFTLRYEQATMEEYHEFFALSDLERGSVLYALVKKQFPLSPLERIISLVFKGFRGKAERAFDIEILMRNILINRFRTYESIFKSEETDQKGLFSANLSMICQKYCISPTDLFKNYTLEQFSWLIDGIIYQANLMDDDGKYKNNRALTDTDAVKQRAKETREAFKKSETQVI